MEDPFLDQDSEESSSLLEKTKLEWFGTRHVFALLGFLGFANVYAMRVNLSVAIVAMVNNTALPKHNESLEDVCPDPDWKINATFREPDGEFVWDEYQQGVLLGSFFWGYVVTQIPGGLLSERFGGKNLLGFGMLITALFTLLTPWALQLHDNLLILCRVLEGLGEGVTFPAMNTMIAKWAPPLERSKLVTFIFAGSQFGTVVALPLSGLLCQYGWSGGWPSVFHVFGVLGLLWFLAWMYFISESPDQHPRISAKEKNYILHSLSHSQIKRKAVPWLSIFKCVPFWALITAHVGQSWAFYTLLTELPSFLKHILHFDIKQNSFVSALPYLIAWLFSLICSTIADTLQARSVLSTSTTRKIFNSIGMYGAALALSGACLTGCSAIGAVTLLTLALGSLGATYSGFHVNHVELASEYAGTLFGITNTFANVCGFAAPYVVGSLLKGKQTLGQWHTVFLIASGICFVSNSVFVLFGTSATQSWSAAGRGKKKENYSDEEDLPPGALN